jgi:hypothetical protein
LRYAFTFAVTDISNPFYRALQAAKKPVTFTLAFTSLLRSVGQTVQQAGQPVAFTFARTLTPTFILKLRLVA